MAIVKLYKRDFEESIKEIVTTKDLSVEIKKYASGIESLKIKNAKGYVEVLPFMGQIIWDLSFNNKSLRLHNIFDMPRKAKTIIDTYGCFAFHSGLLANGCPAPDDTHQMHGEFSVMDINEVYLEVLEDSIKVVSKCNYCQGFGFHYVAIPSVTLKRNSTYIDIDMDVTNLTASDMPLQYMCHMNYAYLDNAKISSNIPDCAFKLRESIPSHVHPTEKWLAYNEELKEIQKEGKTLSELNEPSMYDPEIVFMADGVNQYAEDAHFEIAGEDGTVCFTKYKTSDFPCATRWIMHNPDLKVAAFVLPATCRPEGFNAAKRAGTLIYLKSGENKHFHVKTGLKDQEIFMKIAVIGSNMVDLISYIDRMPNPGETIEAPDFSLGCGGKGANQAVAAAKCGADVMMLTKVGSDLFGKNTIENLNNFGIDTSCCEMVDGMSSGVAPIFVDKNSQNSILIIKGANKELKPCDIDKAADKLKECKLIVLQLEISLKTVYYAIAFGKKHGISVLLNPAPADPNLDLDKIKDCEFFVPNESELATLTKMPVDTDEQVLEAANFLIKAGIKNVIVTMGSRGSMLVNAQGVTKVPCFKVKAIDTTGAGDAFIGSFSDSYVKTLDIVHSMKVGSAFAALSVTKRGTQKSYPEPSEVQAFLEANS